jgi:serine/threonine-protein kinase
MATVHLGRLLGAAGFRRTVAVKRLHRHLAGDSYFRSMLVEEARVAARIRHANVVGTIDVVGYGEELLLVMEYVLGESLWALLRALRDRGERVPLPIASSLMCGALAGLHAAHEARDECEKPLDIVHRDVSPPNILVGIDGTARVVDFGIAKASGRMQHTRGGQVKGKFGYMAPEQLAGQPLDRRADIYAASVILWEMIANRPLVGGESDADVFREALRGDVQPPSTVAPSVSPALDRVTVRGLARNPDERYATAREMGLALEAAVSPATANRVGEWVESVAGAVLAGRRRALAEFEALARDSDGGVPQEPGEAVAPASGAGQPLAPHTPEPWTPALPTTVRPIDEPRMEELEAADPHTQVHTQVPTQVVDGLPAGWAATPASNPGDETARFGEPPGDLVVASVASGTGDRTSTPSDAAPREQEGLEAQLLQLASPSAARDEGPARSKRADPNENEARAQPTEKAHPIARAELEGSDAVHSVAPVATEPARAARPAPASAARPKRAPPSWPADSVSRAAGWLASVLEWREWRRPRAHLGAVAILGALPAAITIGWMAMAGRASRAHSLPSSPVPEHDPTTERSWVPPPESSPATESIPDTPSPVVPDEPSAAPPLSLSVAPVATAATTATTATTATKPAGSHTTRWIAVPLPSGHGATRSAPAARSKACDPPWTVDSAGIRRPRLECL